MIIWGWRAITRNGESGQFNCPNCNVRRPYQRKKLQRFFTLYFIPLIPLQVLQETIECQVCKKLYTPAVLTFDPAKVRAEQSQALSEAFKPILLHFAGLSGRRDHGFFRYVAKLFRDFEGGDMSAHEVSEGIDPPRLNVEPETIRIRPLLSEAGRENVVTGALAAATADGQLTEAKRAAIGELATGLGMSATHLTGVLAGWTAPVVASSDTDGGVWAS
jgi:hypothetical protein